MPDEEALLQAAVPSRSPAPAATPAPPTTQLLAVTRPMTGNSVMPGQEIYVADPQGNRFSTRVPPNIAPGQTFHVRVPIPQADNDATR